MTLPWIQAIRPKTLWAGFAPVLMGAALAFAESALNWLFAALCLLFALALQIGCNLANDYFDAKKGADTPDRLGPVRVTQSGLISPAAVRRAAGLCFGIASLIALAMIQRGGLLVVIILVTAVITAICYTGGPFPLGYNGLGDVAAFIYFGPVAVGGTHYIMTDSWSTDAIIAGFGPGFLSVAILTVNNLRDLETDRAAHKRTLIVMWGRTYGRIHYTVALIAAALVPVVLILRSGSHHAVAIASLACVLAIVPLVRAVWRETGRPLNQTLGATARLLLVYSILFAVGWNLPRATSSATNSPPEFLQPANPGS